MRAAILNPLVRPTIRAIKWLPLAAAGMVGLAIVLVPEALTSKLTTTPRTELLRLAVICTAIGAAFILDDPAARSTPTVPTSRLVRNVLRVGLATPAIALWWAATLVLARALAHPMNPPIPAAAVTLEAATVVVIALALAATAQRLTRDTSVGIVAAPTVLALVGVIWFLPQRMALLFVPGDPQWTASHQRWAILLGVAAMIFILASREKPARRLRSRRFGGSAMANAPTGVPGSSGQQISATVEVRLGSQGTRTR